MAQHHGVVLSFAQAQANHTPVTSIRELAIKYGNKSIGLVVQEFIARSPGFSEAEEFSAVLGEMMADLEAAIKSWQKENR